jgi:amino acid transporter
MAPSTSPSLTIPLVFALAGNGTWFVYGLTTVAMLLVGFCVSRFARMSASPGSLYTYTADTLRPSLGAIAAWALLIAYLATGASVAGGALYYANILLGQFLSITAPALVILAIVFLITGAIAMRDVKLSAEMMLWVEVVSVSLRDSTSTHASSPSPESLPRASDPRSSSPCSALSALKAPPHSVPKPENP